jgi:hypothetical protein
MKTTAMRLPSTLLTGAVVNAAYIDQSIPGHSSNPLIDALPTRWDRETATSRLRHTPPYNETMRTFPAIERIYLVQEILNLFEPLPQHITLERIVSDNLRLGLRHRNPLDRNYWHEKDENAKILTSSLETSQNFDHAAYKRKPLRLAIPHLGDSGMGKSRSQEEILLLYPQVILHSNYPTDRFRLIDGFIQIVWVKLEIPANGSLKSLCLDFFRAVDTILHFQGTKYLHDYAGTVDQMIGNIAHVVGLHGIGLIVIDELQRLVSSKDRHNVLNFFEAMINLVGVPLCIVGTEAAYELLSGTFSTARRLTGTRGLNDWKRLENDEIWDYFMECLWEYQYTAVPTEFTPELSKTFYYETQGIIDLVIKLHMMVQIHLIEMSERDPSFQETITSKIVSTLAQDGFKHIQSKLNLLRKGENTQIQPEHFRQVDIENYIRRTINQIAEEKQSALNMLQNQKSKSKSPKVVQTEQTERAAIRESVTDYKIIPNGLLDAYHYADRKHLSKYETYKEAGFVWTPTYE